MEATKLLGSQLFPAAISSSKSPKFALPMWKNCSFQVSISGFPNNGFQFQSIQPSASLGMKNPTRIDESEIYTLDGIRSSLIRQEDSIIFSLVERAQYCYNEDTYDPKAFFMDGFQGSLVEFMVQETEKIHAKVGRYKNPDEHPFFPNDLPEPMLPPLQYPQVLHPSADSININRKIWDMYFKDLLPRLVKKGNDGNCGSTATCDTICLQALSKRIHYGKFVLVLFFRNMDESRGGGRRVEKRVYDEEDDDGMPQSKKPKVPGLASVIVEALKVDSLQRLCSSLEPLFRRIVSEEVERALTRFGHGQIDGRSSPPRIQGQEGKVLQLEFRTRMPPHLFTGGKVEGEQGAAIHVVLLDAATGNVMQTGEESSSKLNVVVLEGDFNEESNENWSTEHFESHEVKAREGKRPLLTGETQVTLNEGVGTLGDLTFTDNSSWIRSRKFRLGLKVASGYCVGIRIREAKTEAFAVKDHRGELYKKHYPPALHDEVWRLDRIAKDGALHKKLMNSEVITVEDFLRVLVRDPQRLRNILGSGMSNRMWENTVEHAKTCVLGGKLYVYYADLGHTTGAIFNHIYELRGLISDAQFVPLESLNHNQKISVDSLVKRAYENWNRVVEYDGKVLSALTYPSPPTHNLIEYPFISSDQTQTLSGGGGSSTTTTTHQSSPPTHYDYVPGAPSTFTGSDGWSSQSPDDGHGFGDSFSEEVRLRSSEMLETDDMQKLLRSFGVGVTASTFGVCDNGSYGYHNHVAHEPQVGPVVHGRGSGKAVVGWLKLKAALRWGIFIRKKAAERRAQLVQLD